MKKRNTKSSSAAAPKRLMPLSRKAQTVINVTFLYEEPDTRSWARDAYERICLEHGAANVRATWWKMNDLTVPGVLAGAVSTAMRADVVLIAATGSEGLPLPFYFWINAWAPHRTQAGGKISAILGAPDETGARTGRVADYLKAVADQTGMEFQLAERSLVLESALSK